jgi:hypothetical protein
VNILRKSKHRKVELGQSLTEMTLGMVVMVFIMSGVIDIGRAYITYIALEDAAGEAALYMSSDVFCPYDNIQGIAPNQTLLANDGIVPDSNDLYPAYTYLNPLTGVSTTYYDKGRCNPPNNALWRAIHAGGFSGLVNWSDSSNLSWTFVCTDGATGNSKDCAVAMADDTVAVTISYNIRLLSPVIPNINGSPTLKLTGTASQTIASVRKLK